MNIQSTIIAIIIILSIAFFIQSIVQKESQQKILNYIDKQAANYLPFYSFVKSEIAKGSLAGVLMYLVFTNIPVLPGLPAEAFVLYAYLKGANLFGLVAITTFVYMIFASIYYLIGFFFGERLVEKLIKRPVKYNKLLDKLSGILLFIVYLVPIPIPIPLATILVLVFGSYRTSFRKVVIAVGMATFIRFLSVILLYQYYTPLISQYLAPIEHMLKVG